MRPVRRLERSMTMDRICDMPRGHCSFCENITSVGVKTKTGKGRCCYPCQRKMANIIGGHGITPVNLRHRIHNDHNRTKALEAALDEMGCQLEGRCGGHWGYCIVCTLLDSEVIRCGDAVDLREVRP